MTFGIALRRYRLLRPQTKVHSCPRCWVRGVEAIRGNCAIDRDRVRCGTGVGGIIGACDGFARRDPRRKGTLC
jgi:hypothetical protein